MVSYCLVDKSTVTDQAFGGALTVAILSQIAAAIEVQLNRDYAPYHGGNFRCRAATPSNPPAGTEEVALITDSIPQAPGAVAYHDWAGVPRIYCGRVDCDSLVSSTGALSVALSHECLEAAKDPPCNLWADDGNGSEVALEEADPVESGTYVIDDVRVSDFVLPAYFAPGSLPPYSFVQSQGGVGPSGPFAIAQGGYIITRRSGTGETQVTGLIHPARLAKKRSATSRTYRRGARV